MQAQFYPANEVRSYLILFYNWTNSILAFEPRHVLQNRRIAQHHGLTGDRDTYPSCFAGLGGEYFSPRCYSPDAAMH